MISRAELEQWTDDYLPGGKWDTSGEYVVSSPFRVDNNPSFAVNFDKRCYRDRARGGEAGKLSELCARLNVPEPGREKKSTGMSGADFDRLLANEKAKKTADKSAEARRLWEQSSPAGADHPYLKRKQISGDGLRQTADGVLLVPAYSIETGELAGVERIDMSEQPGRQKRHLGQKAGTFFLAGDLDADTPILVAEGAATALSLHEITSWPCVSSFGAPGLVSVAKELRRKHPAKDILVCPDFDQAGRSSAVEARKAGFTVVSLPEGSAEKYDWNDVHVKRGLEQGKEIFRDCWQAAEAAGTMDAETREEKEPVAEATERARKDLRSLRRTIEPQRGRKPEMVAGIFPRGCVSVVAGPQGTGKSLLMQKCCSDLSMGGEILDGVVSYAPRRKTVYFVGELPLDTMNDRQRTAAWAHDDENFILYSRTEFAKARIALDLDDGEGFDNVCSIIADEKPDMVVFDSLMSFITCDESDMKAMQALFSKLVRLSDSAQCAVVGVHHIRKRKTMERAGRLHMDDIIGSSIITRNAALALGAEKVAHDDGEQVYVATLKTWYAPLDEFAFTIVNDEAKVFRGLEMDLNPKSCFASKKDAVEDAVFKGHKDGSEFTVSGIAAVSGASASFVRRIFGEWTTQEKIFPRGGGKNTSYSILQKYQNDLQTLMNTENHSATAVAVSSGMREKGENHATHSATPSSGMFSGDCKASGAIPLQSHDTKGADRRVAAREKPAGESSSPRGQKILGAKDVRLPDAIRWARGQGLLAAIRARAEAQAGDMIEIEKVFAAGVRAEYADFLNSEAGADQDDSSEAVPTTSQGAGAVPSLAVPEPASVSLESIAALAGVDVEAVLEGVSPWVKVGRLKVEGTSVRIIEGATGYPDDEDDAPDDAPDTREDEDDAAPDEPDDAPPDDTPDTREDEIDAAPAAAQEPDAAAMRAWLAAQGEAVRAEYQARLDRLRRAGLDADGCTALTTTYRSHHPRLPDKLRPVLSEND